jgi:PAS domain S-box-containing protein
LDITERKQAEEALRESEQRFREIFTKAADAIIVADTETKKFFMVNDMAGKMLGYTKDELSQLGVADIHPPEALAYAQEQFELQTAQKIDVASDLPMRRSDGSVWYADVSSFTIIIQGKTYLMGTFRDVTQRKQAEEAIRQSQKTFSELIERAPFGIYVVDSQFCIAMMNRGSQEGAFLNVRPVIGRDFAEVMRILWPEPVAAEIIGCFRHTLETGEPYLSPRFVNPRADVEIVESYEWELQRLTLPDGQPGVICYYYDSTHLREAEAALRESQAQLRTVFDNLSEGVVVSALDGQMLNWNRSALKMHGLASLREGLCRLSEIKEFYELRTLDGAIVPFKDLPLSRILRGEQLRDLELKILRLDKEFERIFSYSGALVRDPEGVPVLGVVSMADITERKQAEEALRRLNQELENRVAARTSELNRLVEELLKEIVQRQRAEQSLKESEERLRLLANELINTQEMERGRLSRDLHDDFGQSLQVLLMQINAILKRHALEPASRQQLENVVSYLLEVTNRVRRFSHDLSPPSLEQLGPTEALRELFEEFQEYHDNLIISADLDEVKDILPLEAGITIYRVAQEFLTNAHKHANATQVAVAMKVLPDKVTISLDDNGLGFDREEVKSRPKDKRGLGLSSIEERLKMLGSQFSLTSRPGEGTSLFFEIMRPPQEKLSNNLEM